MADDLRDPLAADIARHRLRVERQLTRLLKQTDSDATLDTIKSVIFDEDENRPFVEYVMALVQLFGPEGDRHIDTLVPAIQDAWNYFPHRRFDGACPAELILREAPWLEPDDLRA